MTEHHGLLDENQAGVRKARFTVDVVQMMMQEDVVNCKRRVNAEGTNETDDDDWPCAKLLYLRKTYPRVNNLRCGCCLRGTLWMLLEKEVPGNDYRSA